MNSNTESIDFDRIMVFFMFGSYQICINYIVLNNLLFGTCVMCMALNTKS